MFIDNTCRCGYKKKFSDFYCLNCGKIFWSEVVLGAIGSLMFLSIGMKTMQASGGFNLFGLLFVISGVIGGPLYLKGELSKAKKIQHSWARLRGEKVDEEKDEDEYKPE